MPTASLLLVPIMSLAEAQLLAILRETSEGVQGIRPGRKSPGGHRETESFVFSPAFALRARAKVLEGTENLEPEFSIADDLSVSATTTDVRAQISEALGRFSRRDAVVLLRQLDWIGDARRRIVECAASVQSKYVLNPDNELLLEPQMQENVAMAVDLSQSSVSRLIRALLVRFPNQSVHPASDLMPGRHFDARRRKYALEQLKQDPAFFDPERGWKKGAERVAAELRRRFKLDYATRTLGADMKKQPRSFGKSDREARIRKGDEVIAEYMKREDLFDSATQGWRLLIKDIREIIIRETGIVLPERWISALSFAQQSYMSNPTISRRNPGGWNEPLKF